jgi:inner membrane protein
VPLVAFIYLLIKKRNVPQRTRWVALGLICPLFYIAFATVNKIIVDKKTKADIREQSLPVKEFFTTPAPFNSLLWYIVAKTDSGYAGAYHSVLDKDRQTPYTFFQKNESLLKNYPDTEDIYYLKKFANDYYTVSKTNDTLEFNVIRFGQILGWVHPDAPFALHYYLMKDADNAAVVQRGRFRGWNKETIYATWKRIFYN